MNIQLITGPLAVSDAPGLSTIDPRFTDIATLVQEGQYQEAADYSQEVLAEGIYDIRIIGYFVYGHFNDTGVAAISAIFNGLTEVLRDNIEAVGPVRNREKHIQTILTWFMKQLSKKLQYEEDRKTGLWDVWLSDISSDEVQEMLDASDALRRALSMVLEDKADTVIDGLSKVNEWLSHFQILVYREPESEPEVEEASSESAPQGTSPATGTSMTLGSESAMVQMRGSVALEILLQKIAAFDALISGGKTSLAALVADDINKVIENFDPRVYFPELFSKFTLKYVTHINRLSAYKDHKSCMEWKAMQELYKVDLQSFTAFDADGIEFTFQAPTAGMASSYGTESPNDEGDMDDSGTNSGGW